MSTSFKVLVADDNQDALSTLSVMLQIMGMEVHEARDGVEAVECGLALRPDFAVLDVGMPRMDGIEAAHTLSRTLGSSRPYLIALTGYGDAQTRRRTKEAGFDEHFVKPLDLVLLEQAMVRIAARKGGSTGDLLQVSKLQ